MQDVDIFIIWLIIVIDPILTLKLKVSLLYSFFYSHLTAKVNGIGEKRLEHSIEIRPVQKP
jgi:hypothetical protein